MLNETDLETLERLMREADGEELFFDLTGNEPARNLAFTTLLHHVELIQTAREANQLRQEVERLKLEKDEALKFAKWNQDAFALSKQKRAETETENQTLQDKLSAAEVTLAECCCCDDVLEICIACETRRDLTTLAQAHRAEIEAKAREGERERIIEMMRDALYPCEAEAKAIEIAGKHKLDVIDLLEWCESIVVAALSHKEQSHE